jgi:hypothetical protein
MLVELLDEDYSVNKVLVLNALEGVDSVFNLQSPTPKNEFCRMFVREGVAEPLSAALLNIVKDNSGEAETSKRRILMLLLLFCQTGQSDARIRDAFGSRSFVICEHMQAPRPANAIDLFSTARPPSQHPTLIAISPPHRFEVD